jgi:hypothetical protein
MVGGGWYVKGGRVNHKKRQSAAKGKHLETLWKDDLFMKIKHAASIPINTILCIQNQMRC